MSTVFICDRCSDFNEGLAVVSKDYKYGFIDGRGNEIIPLQYDYACEFNNGFARVMKDEKWSYIKRDNLQLLVINEIK